MKSTRLGASDFLPHVGSLVGSLVQAKTVSVILYTVSDILARGGRVILQYITVHSGVPQSEKLKGQKTEMTLVSCLQSWVSRAFIRPTRVLVGK